jgi:V/A-type H+-transporting ATPase subunit I
MLEGIKGLTMLTKVFGDLLSYLRLFALGLASSSLAVIFNHNAAHALREQTGMNILNCLLIWVTGHTVNLSLCLMSGIVHGLRLNFIEYFSWSVSEEGYPFKAFSKKEIQE